jgi:hypothetical protein
MSNSRRSSFSSSKNINLNTNFNLNGNGLMHKGHERSHSTSLKSLQSVKTLINST